MLVLRNRAFWNLMLCALTTIFVGSSAAQNIKVIPLPQGTTELRQGKGLVNPASASLPEVRNEKQPQDQHMPGLVPIGPATVSQQQQADVTSTSTPNSTSFYAAPFARDGSVGNYGEYGAFGIAYGDFRHAGVRDVVTVQVDGLLNFMANDGKGHYAKTSSNLSAKDIQWFNIGKAVAADLNGDGYLDIVAFNSYVFGAQSPGYLVWTNKADGTGTFNNAAYHELPVPSTLTSRRLLGGFDVADVNKDGRPDIVESVAIVTKQTDGTYQSDLYLMTALGNGDGTFAAPVASVRTWKESVHMSGLQLSDMNNDGILDAVIQLLVQPTTYSAYATMSIALGDGAGNFPASSWVANEMWASTMYPRYGTFSVGDLDHDGANDVILTTATTYGFTFPGKGDGTFKEPFVSASAISTLCGVTLGDFNGDGVPDADFFGDGIASIYNGVGDGTFATIPAYEYPGGQCGVEANLTDDINADGIADFIWPDWFFNQLMSFRGKGDGSFAAAPAIRPLNISDTPPNNTQSGLEFSAIANGDYNGDGKTDLLLDENGVYLDIGLSDGKGGFTFTRAFQGVDIASFGLEAIHPIHLDFNGDGFEDIVFTSWKNSVVVALSAGDGTIRGMIASGMPATLPNSPQCSFGVAGASDIDGDGIPDVVLPYPGDTACYGDGAVPAGYFIFKGEGGGSFISAFYPAGEVVTRARVADLNKDGKLDIVLSESIGSSGTSRILVVPGNGTITPDSSAIQVIWTSPLLAYPRNFLLDDIDGDGNPDLTVSVDSYRDPNAMGVNAMLGGGNFTFGAARTLLQGVNGSGAYYADFNHDGQPDIAVALGTRTRDLNGVAILTNQGNGTFSTPTILPGPIDRANHINANLLVGNYRNSGIYDIVTGGGNFYVPSVIYLNSATTEVALSADAFRATQGDPVTFTAVLNSLSEEAPTGTVQFSAGSLELGLAGVNGGAASLTSSDLPVGSNTVVATYSGDSNHAGGASSISVTVEPLAPEFELGPTVSSLSLGQDEVGDVALTLKGNQTFSGTVTFSCVGLPKSTTCSFSPASVSLGPKGTGAVTAKITRGNGTAHVAALNYPRTGLASMLACSTLLCGVVLRRSKKTKMALISLVVLTSMVILNGCGDGSDNKSPAVTTNVTIVATGTSGGTTITKSVPVLITLR